MFIPCLLLNGPMTRLYCRYLWPKKTSASIGPDGVKINGKLYPVEGGDEIQFRASEPYVKPQKLRELEKAINGQRKWIQHADYRVNFRKIEFIYGAKVVLIANVPNDELAQQFVAVLQEAFKRTMNPNAESQSFLSELQGQKANNYLPE